ncbi:MAG TPA: PfkB family carbohydrate kinase [Roseiarcus sp.]|nr:PfkB family carbohydrate kinase [Roseiarcus sp.]
MRRRATMADVSRLAGVSIGTVSNFLNRTAAIRPKTRERVEAAIRELSFRPNTLARSLTTGTRPSAASPRPSDLPRLIVVGHISADFTAMVSTLPHRNDRATAYNIEKSLGGPAANSAVIAAGLGDRFPLAVELVTAIGDDADSDWALAELALRHVDTIAIRRQAGQRLSRCIVLVESNGSRTIVNEPVSLFESDLAPYVGPNTDQRRCIHVGGFQIPGLLEPVLSLGKTGALLSLQTTGLPRAWQSRAKLAELIGCFDLVFLNRDVAREATECRGGHAQLIEATIDLVRSSRQTGIVILTLGEEGALILEPAQSGVRHVPAIPIDIVDATGAGDAFGGAFLAVWLNTQDPVLATRYGTAAGSLIVTVQGAQGCVPSASSLAEALKSADRKASQGGWAPGTGIETMVGSVRLQSTPAPSGSAQSA